MKIEEEHEALKKHCEGLERVLDDQIKEIMRLEIIIEDINREHVEAGMVIGQTFGNNISMDY